MNRKKIYLAGGCYWGVEKYISSLQGVLTTTVGFANGKLESPTYAQVKQGDTGHVETVCVEYDPQILPLRVLLKLFYRIIDPTLLNRQGPDVGTQYRTGVFFTDPEDAEIVYASRDELAAEYDSPLVMEAGPLNSFWLAEEYHQKYLDKNPGGYCHVPWEEIQWAKGLDASQYDEF